MIARDAGGVRLRRPALLLAFVVGFSTGCDLSPYSSGGCGPPQRATDARAVGVSIREQDAPCTESAEGVRGANGHLVAHVACPGTSSSFLVAIRVEEEPVRLVEATCAGFGNDVMIDAGPWEPADSLWYTVELVVDPLNLFHEDNEKNNRWTGQIRIVGPDIGMDGLTRIADAFHFATGTIQFGDSVFVIASGRIRGRYQSVRFSATSGSALQRSQTLSFISCGVVQPSLVTWSWKPPSPGTFAVEFRVEALSGEADSDTTNNVLTRTLTVRAASAPAR